ncbi:MAG: glycosyltransferase [Alphaproteobacteria bacterium]|jgi:vancomycin aglycone glucosyltransferase|nr:MAG: glycosyltransferase [Alphaproteobacteria bacterium]
MRVLLSTFGSRGDVEPMVALGASLIAQGAEAIVSAPPDQEFIDLFVRADVPFAPAFYSVRQWITDKAKPSAPSDFGKLAAEVMAGQHAALDVLAKGCDVIVATGLFPSTAAAQAVAEKRGIRFLHTNYCPVYLPSTHHRPALWQSRPFPPGVTDPRALWDHNAETMNLLFGAALNAHRSTLGLRALANVRDHVQGDRPLLASDPIIWLWQPTDLCHPAQTGAWVLPDARPLPDDLLAFLDAGDPPVYAGFGSMAIQDSADAARTAIEAIRGHGRRAVIARGWANLALIDGEDDCFITGDINQQALFPRVAAVIHHGGAGTTTAAARAGAPQVIVPQVADQPHWAARIAALGIGAAHAGAIATPASLSEALAIALAPETRTRAAEIARQMSTDGADIAADLLLSAPSGPR